MDHFGVEKAHVVGYSMGGLVAQQLAHNAPDRVQRMVLIATTAGRGSFRGSFVTMLNILAPVRYLSPRMYAKTAGSLVGGRARHDKAWVAAQGELRLQHRPPWRGYLNQLFSIMWWSGFSILGSIRNDVLVLAGDDDPINPVVNAMMLTHMLPNGRLVVMRGEGHLMTMDPESGTHALIREFMGAPDLNATRVWQEASTVDVDELETVVARATGVMRLTVDAMIRRRWLRRKALPTPPHAMRSGA